MRDYKYLASNEAKKIPKVPKYQNFHIANREPLIATRRRQSPIRNRQCLNLALLRMRLVGLDDHLHEFVPHHVFITEVNKVYAVDARQDAFGLDQTAAFARRQIDLGHVAGDHCFRAKSNSRQKHFHLFAGRVLRFVKDYECIRKRAPAHEGQRRYFDHTLFQQFGHPLVIDQVEQRIVKRPQVRIDFLLQISGKKAELFTGFNRRARQHYAIHLLLHQRLDGHRYAQISLAGTRGADPKHDVFLLNRLDVTTLHRGFRRYLFFAGRTKTRAGEVVAQAVGAVLRDLCESLAQFFIGELPAFGKQGGKIFQNPFDGLDILRIAVNVQAVAAAVDLNVEQRLEVLNVLVVNAEKRFQSAWWKLDLLQLMKISPGEIVE